MLPGQWRRLRCSVPVLSEYRNVNAICGDRSTPTDDLPIGDIMSSADLRLIILQRNTFASIAANAKPRATQGKFNAPICLIFQKRPCVSDRDLPTLRSQRMRHVCNVLRNIAIYS